MKIVFATGNPNKVREINDVLTSTQIEIVPMSALGFTEDIPETGKTLEENAHQKSQYLHEKLQVNIIAEDTGLEVNALNGAPGIITARYAGPQRNDNDNMNLLLNNLTNLDRSARFRTAISLLLNGEQHTFEGIVNGSIAQRKIGTMGFGYDPIFIPNGYDKTFAELGKNVKSQISHRARAVNQLIEFLQGL